MNQPHAEKRLNPRLFGTLSHAQLWQVFQAWEVGDGRKMIRERETSATTTSEWLAAQMGFVALANGLFPRTYVSHTSKRSGPCYDVHLFPSNWRNCKPGFGTRNMQDEHLLYTPAVAQGQYRHAAEVCKHYAGPVFDLQIDGAESFVTSSGIAHNCRLYGVAEGMECPHGCKPKPRYLTRTEAYRLLDAVGATGDPSLSTALARATQRR